MPTVVLEEDVRPAPGGSNTGDLQNPPLTRTSDPAPAERPPAARGPQPRRRYHELDLLRFVAAVAVVLFHYFFRASVQQPVFAETGFTDPHGIFRYGYLGVDLFFVISGFVILNSAWKKRPSAFVASRIGRLYPAFWVAVTLTAIVLILDPNKRFTVTLHQYLVNLTMAPKLFDVGQIDGVYWTLLVELKFYLLVLGLCALGITLNRVLGFAIGWLTLSLWHELVPLPRTLEMLLVPEWAPYFVAGILFALIAREGWRPRYVAPLVVACAWSLCLAVRIADKTTAQYGLAVKPVVVLAIVGGIFVVFGLIAADKLRARWTAKVAFLGGLTYPLYLLHENIGFVLFELIPDAVPRWVVLAVVLATVTSAAWLLHVIVEERCAVPLANWLQARWASVRRVSAGTERIDDANTRRWSRAGLSTPQAGMARIH